MILIARSEERGNPGLVTGGGLALQPYAAYLPLSMDKAALRAMVQALSPVLKEKGIYIGSGNTFQKNNLRSVIIRFSKENMAQSTKN